MGKKENNSRSVRKVLGVILILCLVIIGGLLTVIGAKEMVANGARSYGFLTTHLWSSITLPLGIYYFLLFGTVMAPLVMGRCMYKKFIGKDQIWRQYQLDTFFWAEWQWDYTWNGKITKLWCECEKCAQRMKPKVVPDGTDDFGVRFICNRCGKQSTTIRSVESETEALERVEKKIMRKIRVGKYRGAIEGRMLEENGERAANVGQ